MHVIDSLAVGGAERMLVDLANASIARGCQVSVCVTRSNTELASELDDRIGLYVLGRRRRFEVKPLFRFAKIVRDSGCSLLHLHSRSSLALCCVLKSLRQLPVPLLLHDHYGGIERNPSVPLWFRVLAPYFLSQYVGVYKKLAAWAMRAGVASNRVAVIGNALERNRLALATSVNIRTELCLNPADKIGVLIAGIRPDKGIDCLLKALGLEPRLEAVKILIIGAENDAKYTSECKQMVITKGLSDCVRFLGPRRDVPGILHEADFGVMASRSESGPLVLLEFLACGLPFVSTTTGDVSQRVMARRSIGFVEPGDATALRAALDHLLGMSGADRLQWAADSAEVLNTDFSLESRMVVWLNLYKKITSRSKHVSC